MMNAQADGAAIHPVMIWVLIFVSILLVSIITYIYTNRNRKVTAYFTVGSVFFLVFVKLVSIVDVEIDSYILNFTQASGEVVHIAGPGWDLLWYGWFIWMLPALISALFVLFFFIGMFRVKKLSLFSSRVEVLPTKPFVNAQSDSSQTRAERLNVFMALDAAKQQVKVTQQKLTESLLINTSNEIQMADLKTQIEKLETELQALQAASRDGVSSGDNSDKLEKELQKKEIAYQKLSQEFVQCQHDLEEAQDLLKKLSGMSGSE